MNKRERIKEIKSEIEGYQPKKRIADAMLELGEIGFEFSGHGCGFGGEDFSLFTKDLYVNLCDQGQKIVVSISNNDEEMEDLFIGTIGQAMRFIQSYGRALR